MKWKNLFILFMFIVICLIVYEIVRLQTLKQCPKPIIQYRYVPRSFKDEQNEPIPVEDIFGKMFSHPSPWMISRSIGLVDKRDTGLGGRKIKI